MNIATILIILLVVCLVVGLPAWGLHGFGYGPSSILGLVLIIFLVLFLLGRA